MYSRIESGLFACQMGSQDLLSIEQNHTNSAKCCRGGCRSVHQKEKAEDASKWILFLGTIVSSIEIGH